VTLPPASLPARLRPLTRRASLIGLAGATAGLAGACAPVAFGPPPADIPRPPAGPQPPVGPGLAADEPAGAPTTPVEAAPLPAAEGGPNVIGRGPVKVGVVLPLTGAGAGVGASLRNAVELATLAAGADQATFLVKDDGSTPDGAKAATQAAIGEGAELVLGPLFGPNMRAAGAVARAANTPLIGFSNDATAAAPGVYLLSLLIESYVDRVIAFAAAQGKKSLAAIAPDDAYGAAAMAAIQTSAAEHGLRAMAAERYPAGSANAAARKIAALGASIDTLFVAELPENAATTAGALAKAGIAPGAVQILGPGVWNDARVLATPLYRGAWFAAPESAGFSAFAQRYRAKYGSEPPRVAALAYDAGSLAIALARTQGAARFQRATLTAPTGFQGADGVFRLRADGLNERGLAVMQIEDGRARMIAAAPRSFPRARPS
jgi:ABC-type branched-subunit amino acid transport system substrate-binding protein